MAISEEEYEAKRERLEADVEDARKAHVRARSRYEQLSDELRNLRLDWQEQQRTARKEG